MKYVNNIIKFGVYENAFTWQIIRMNEIKCPVAGCTSTSFQFAKVQEKHILVCGYGHFISRDYTYEFEVLAQGFSANLGGLQDALNEHMRTVKKEIAGLKETISAMAKKQG